VHLILASSHPPITNFCTDVPEPLVQNLVQLDLSFVSQDVSPSFPLLHMYQVTCSLFLLTHTSVAKLPFSILLSSDWMTIGGVWTGNRIYWTLRERNYTNNYASLSKLHTPKITVNYREHKVFTSRCLLAAFNGRHSLSSGFPNSPASATGLSVLTTANSKLTQPTTVRIRVTLRLAVYRQ
jgi:hypothetical protein